MMLMMVTDRRRVAHADTSDLEALIIAVGRSVDAGATMIQVRERDLDDAVLFDLTARLVRRSTPAGVKVVVNDRVDVAMAAGAAGVHLPASGVAPDRVRAIAPGGFLIGRSVHSEAEAVAAERTGACDYLVFGSVYPTASKPPGHEPAGIDAFARACRMVRLPVLAIGGIDARRAREVARAGAAGIAAIGLFAGEDDDNLKAAVREITHAFASE
jgi:thiamine-phosphate pyrophosphorylase